MNSMSNDDLFGKFSSGKEVLKALVSSVNKLVDEASAVLNRTGSSFLVEACKQGDISTVKKLLEEGNDVNQVTEEGECLLFEAASSGHFELAQLLIWMKANVDYRGQKDLTPLMEASRNGHLDVVNLLIQYEADVNAQTSNEQKLEESKYEDPDDVYREYQQVLLGTMAAIVYPEGNTPLMFACSEGHEEIVKVLLDAGAHVDNHNGNGHTPLMVAAKGGYVGIARLLVKKGASINTRSKEYKESALTLACFNGHFAMVHFLLEVYHEPKLAEMQAALMEASVNGYEEIARLLLDSGAQVKMPNSDIESPLTLAACGGHVELAMLLLERGANMDQENEDGYTPLMEAAKEGYEEIVTLLISRGADVNGMSKETCETALSLACCGGFLYVADLLVQAGADIELGALTPLMEAAQQGHIQLVRYLIIAGADVNATTEIGDTALTFASGNGHTAVAELLIRANAKVEQESLGVMRTPLMKAAGAGHLCTVDLLLSKGADVHKQTPNNEHNSLSLASAGGHLRIVELLLAYGANPNQPLRDNSNVLIEASRGGHTEVARLLLDYPNSLLAAPLDPVPEPDAFRVPFFSFQSSKDEVKAELENTDDEDKNFYKDCALIVRFLRDNSSLFFPDTETDDVEQQNNIDVVEQQDNIDVVEQEDNIDVVEQEDNIDVVEQEDDIVVAQEDDIDVVEQEDDMDSEEQQDNIDSECME